MSKWHGQSRIIRTCAAFSKGIDEIGRRGERRGCGDTGLPSNDGTF